MEHEGTVSIWLGKCVDIKDLQHYLQVNYSKFGDYLNSKFEMDFKFECFDEDLKEINFIERDSDSFSDIIKDQSFSENIISDYGKKFTDKLDREYNSIILLYDFNYDGSIKEASGDNVYVKFVGSFKYRKMNNI